MQNDIDLVITIEISDISAPNVGWAKRSVPTSWLRIVSLSGGHEDFAHPTLNLKNLKIYLR